MGLIDSPTPRPGLRFPFQEEGGLGGVVAVINAVVALGRCPQLPLLEGNQVSNPADVTWSWNGVSSCVCQAPAVSEAVHNTLALTVPLRRLEVSLGVS